jgi:radical SAM superfamily enzyme YgiQ (UPF0313 family)
MDVLLIFPPYERLMGIRVKTFPVGLGSIATMLAQNNYDTGIYNAEVGLESSAFKYLPEHRANAFSNLKKNLHCETNAVWDEIKEVIKQKNPKIVGITSYVSTNACVMKIARIAKEVCGCHVVIGGPYPTLLPEENCWNEYVDYVVSGEGEYTMLELSDFLLMNRGDRTKIQGISFMSGGNCVTTSRRDRIPDLDTLPFIDHDLLINKNSTGSEWTTIVASRGCPHRCAFCASVPIWGRKVVFRSPRSLVDEIEKNYDRYGGKSFRFLDDTFISNANKTKEFCGLFIERGLNKKLSWGCLSRVNSVSENLLKALEEANCRSIALGVESGSDRILKTLKKDITKDLVREKVRLVRKSKLRLHLYFMIGSPFEKEEDIIETYHFIKELKPDSINLCTFTPYYGTELYDICVKKGILPAKHDVTLYEDIGHHNKCNYFCRDIEQKRYEELVEMMMGLADSVCERVTKKKVIARSGYYLRHPVAGMKKVVEKLRN